MEQEIERLQTPRKPAEELLLIEKNLFLFKELNHGVLILKVI